MTRNIFLFLIFFLSLVNVATAAQKKPKIVGQNPVSTPEENSRVITLDDLVIEFEDDEDDDDEDDESNLHVEVNDGENYTHNENTIVPALDFNGELVVPVSVTNDGKKSNTYQLSVDVTPVNDPPVIEANDPVTLLSAEPFEIQFDHLSVADPDNNYPEGFSLSVQDGANYSRSGNTVTPTTGYVGLLNIPVQVYDGALNSETYNFQANVAGPANDVPEITGQQSLQILEEQSLQFDNSFLTVSDDDNTYPDDFTVTLSSGDNYTLSGTTITPTINFSGTLLVPVTVNDGTDTSAPFYMAITVQPVNDPPVITGQGALQTLENSPLTITLADLVVQDPDNNYPDNFTMQLYEGSNYTFSGTTITPSPNFSGVLQVPVTVNDGQANSAVYSAQVTVTSVNNRPSITGQSAATINENESFTIGLQHLTVSDADNNYPDGFSLVVDAGPNFTVSGSTVTPSPGFNGNLSVPVRVNDGSEWSDTFQFLISVNAVNDVPVISGQVPLETNEDSPITIVFEHLTVEDDDNSYPTGFDLQVQAGTNYTVSGRTVTPVANYHGTLSVPVIVNDGTDNSAAFNLQINVIPQNDIPVITSQTTVSTLEETPVTLSLNQLQVTDPDNEFPSGFQIQVSPGENYTVNGTVVTPANEFSGNLSVPVVVTNGVRTSNPFSLMIAVTAQNDAPVITGHVPFSIAEETPLTFKLADFFVTDADNAYPQGFTLNVQPGENYTLNGNTITPATDFNGTLTVPVFVNDGTTNSNTFNTAVMVGSSNDAPVITGQVQLQTNEDSPFTIQLSHLQVTDSDNTYPTGFSLLVHSGANYTVAGATITPSQNFNGVLTVPVQVSDGTSPSAIFNLTVTVIGVNDPPTITGQVPISILRDASLTIQFNHLTVTDVDNNYPSGFVIIAGSGTNYTASGNLITPAQGFTGTLNIPVRVNDGTADSPPFTLVVTVNAPPNVKPVILSSVSLTTYENEPIKIELSHLVVQDPDNRYPDDFTLHIFDGANYSISGNSVIPFRDFSGTLNVRVAVSDPEISSAAHTMQIKVIPVSDVPQITGQQFLRIAEDDSIGVTLSQLQVLDPDSNFPNGFSLTVMDGEHYSIQGNNVKPESNFSGYLSVPITVSDGENTSPTYQLLILVEPVNDPPAVTLPENAPLLYTGNAVFLWEQLEVSDADNDSLSLAEVEISENYDPDEDSLFYTEDELIRAVFDRSDGVLLFFGKASVAQYQKVLRSIGYQYGDYKGSQKMQKSFSVLVSDGQDNSNSLVRIINFDRGNVALDIPSGFTPNGDGVNDTWSIRPTIESESYSNTLIRIYNKRGILVFETRGLDNEWDGRFNGALLPADSYFYTIDVSSRDINNRYRGVITILR